MYPIPLEEFRNILRTIRVINLGDIALGVMWTVLWSISFFA